MAPISSGSSTWTSSGIHFSIVSMATGMGPSSSGSQATVASVVTSSLLAGLGVGGGVISSLPSSVWPTQAPRATQSPNRPTTTPAQASTEQTASQSSETDAGSEDKQAEREGEEDEGETEGEKDEGGDEKKKKTKTAPDNEEQRSNSSVAAEPSAPTPASTAKEKGEGKPTVKGSAAPTSAAEEHSVAAENNATEVTTVSTQEPRNDSAEMQIPQSSTQPPKMSVDGKNDWPFSVHTGEHICFFKFDNFPEFCQLPPAPPPPPPKVINSDVS